MVLSTLKKKKNLFLMIGPPTLPPKLSKRSKGTLAEKKFLAFRSSFWKYSYAEPCHWFVPPLLIWLNTAPPTPYWAEKVEVFIWTSATSSKTIWSKFALCG